MPNSRATDSIINRLLKQQFKQGQSTNNQRLNQLTGFQLEQALGRSTDSQFFQSGMEQLNQQVNRVADTDATAAAARGLTGSSFEIAQLGQRNNLLARGTGQLLTAAEQNQNNQRQGVLSSILSQNQLDLQRLNADRSFSLSAGQLALQQQLRRDQRRAQNQAFVSNLFSAGTSLLGGFLGGGAG